jgi:predicted secreted protein
MKITKLLLSISLLILGLDLQAQEPAKLKPVIKAPSGKVYPAHWGRPPLRQTRDMRILPGGYGRGSGTLARWIQENLDKDAKKPGAKPMPVPPLAVDPVAPLPVAPPVFDPNAKAREKAEEQAKVDTAKVQAAINAWEKAKTESKGNYSYKVSFTSWVGFGNETIIVVENNKVTERRYRSFNRRQPVPVPRPGGAAPLQPEGDSYLEKGTQLGKNKKGAPAKTLDELYEIALATAKKPLKEFERRYIRSDKQGLLVSCYIMDRRIADDAPRNGLVVSSITLGKVSTASSNGDDVTRLTAKDNGKTITVKAGQRIEISLAGNPTTGFTWNNVTRGHGVKLLGKITHKAGGRALGAPGMSTATFQAMKPGKNEISLGYRRVFEKNPPIKTFKVTVAVTEGGTSSTKPAVGNHQARIVELQKEIVRMKDFARRARFTPEGLRKHNAKLAELEKELAILQAGEGKPDNVKVYRAPNGKPFPTHWGAPPLRLTRDLRPFPGGYGQGSGTLAKWIQKNMDADKAKGGGKTQTGNPTFEEWVEGGKKIPAGRVFIGGSPWFNERTGKRRSAEEVYKMLYGNKGGGNGGRLQSVPRRLR